MKKIVLILLVFIAIHSCEKENQDANIPDYQPGRLTKISFETPTQELTYHNYEYAENDIIDRYHYISHADFVSTYHFQSDHLKTVYYSYEGTSEEYYIDSIEYTYSPSQIIEITYMENSRDTVIYFIENGKIRSSTNKSPTSDSGWRTDSYYYWTGNNLTKYEVHNWFLRPSPIVNTYIYEYSEIENPLFHSNIPRLMKDLGSGGDLHELSDIIPKCSKNLPSQLSIYISTIPDFEEIYYLKSETFPNINKPYMVRVNQTYYGSQYSYEYFLDYERLLQ